MLLLQAQSACLTAGAAAGGLRIAAGLVGLAHIACTDVEGCGRAALLLRAAVADAALHALLLQAIATSLTTGTAASGLHIAALGCHHCIEGAGAVVGRLCTQAPRAHRTRTDLEGGSTAALGLGAATIDAALHMLLLQAQSACLTAGAAAGGLRIAAGLVGLAHIACTDVEGCGRAALLLRAAVADAALHALLLQAIATSLTTGAAASGLHVAALG